MREEQVKTTYMRIIVWSVMAVFLCLEISGCIVLLGAGAGVGGAAYVLGDLENEVAASVPILQRATVAGLEALNMPIVKEQGDKLTAEIESKTADDKSVKIHIASVTPRHSKISIRVGLIGDETRSLQIWDSIRKRL